MPKAPETTEVHLGEAGGRIGVRGDRMDKNKLLTWLNERVTNKEKTIKYRQDNYMDDSEAICELLIYQKVIEEVEKGTFD